MSNLEEISLGFECPCACSNVWLYVNVAISKNYLRTIGNETKPNESNPTMIILWDFQANATIAFLVCHGTKVKIKRLDVLVFLINSNCSIPVVLLLDVSLC